MRSLLYTLSITFLLFSCNNSSTSEAETANDPVNELKLEVMKIHDEVMPKMGDMGSLMTILKKMDPVSPEDSLNIMKGYTALKSSHDGMMRWMHEFQNPDDQDWTEEEKLEYLNQEKQKIAQIGIDVEEALAISNQIVNQSRESAQQ